MMHETLQLLTLPLSVAAHSYLQLDWFGRLLLPISLLLTTYFAYNLLFHPLSRVPGPLSARLGISSFRFFSTQRKDYAWKHKALHDKYGDTVRLGPNFISTTSPDAVRSIYAHGSKFTKTRFYPAFQSIKNRPSLFSDIDPASHSSRRRSVAHVYSMTSLVDLEQFVDPCVSLLLSAIDKKILESEDAAKAGQSSLASIEINSWLQYFAADVVGELAFGNDLGFLRAGHDVDSFLAAATNLTVFGAIAGSLPSIQSLVSSFLRRTSSLSPTVIGKQTWRLVNHRFDNISSFFDEDGEPMRRDMLNGFMKAKYPGTNETYRREDVVSQATTVFGAGSDTTAVAMNAFFYYVLKNPRVYATLQAEIDAAFEEGRLQLPVMYGQGAKLDYLQACIKESMRLLTPVGMEMPRFVPDEGMVVGKYFLPKGTEIGANAFTFHRVEEAFGRDADVFRPERWLNISENERATMERNNLAFGAGSRICIGKNISLMEMTKILPTLFWRYSFSFTPRSEDGPHKYALGRGLDGMESKEEPLRLYSSWFFEVKDFWCNVSLRREEE